MTASRPRSPPPRREVEAFVDTGANLVTKANMKDEKIDALLNPKLD